MLRMGLKYDRYMELFRPNMACGETSVYRILHGIVHTVGTKS